ncbi:Lrp/AsnC family transcriptional regulator [Leucobacter sp. CSA2]|uniref:Lrp/AsnC family transcriptional regulator n=1 Tax=Leucobacter edaphi TaxID=2796472 RepID=A0A934QC57_9MICO|nr:Lrp/AsnC family transcriptional regulator [Leucobacter edaphi]MBK0420582.1 Lrp/AsnC family transcriptional regulator [Leucobacter edaphi]
MAETSGRNDSGSLDESLLRALRDDGRASIKDLAALLGVSRDVVSQRLRLLSERDGLRVVAALDPRFAGHNVLTNSKVEVEGPAAPVARRIAELDSTVFVSLTSGQYPIVFESRDADPAGLHRVLDAVRSIPGVRQVRVTTYVEIIKGFFVADERVEIRLDALDEALIAELQVDGRASYRALADTVHLSPSSARARVHRMIDAGVIRISTITSGMLSQGRLAIGLGIIARGDAAPIVEALRADPAVDLAARSHGSYDFVATIVGNSAKQLLGTIEALRGVPEVGSVESWTHYDIVKESYDRATGGTLSR